MHNDAASSGGLPEEVRTFLRERIEGYEQLEVLLLLYAEAHSRWNGASVSEVIRIAPDAAEIALAALRSRSLVTATKEGETVWYQYAADSAVGRTVQALARAYVENHLDVMRAMNADAIQRVRTQAIRTFADAFIFRPKRK